MSERQKKFTGIVLLIPSSGRKVDIEWSMSLATFGYPVGMNHAWFVSKPSPQLLEIAKAKGTTSTRDLQRDSLVEKALAIGAQHIMFLDDDTLCPPETIQELFYVMQQNPKAGIVGGIYCTKTVPTYPIVFKEIGGGPFWNWTIGDVFPVEGLGTGCMLIRAEVFKNIPKPWFVDHAHSESGKTETFGGVEMNMVGSSGTDDIHFCEKALDAGYDILAHGGILPVHIDYEDDTRYALPLNSYPMTTYIARLKAQGDPMAEKLEAQAKAAAEKITKLPSTEPAQ